MMTWTTFTLFTVAHIILSFIVADPQQSLAVQFPFHPFCDANSTTNNARPVAKSVTDITRLFHGLNLPDGACVFNPALVHISGNLYCIFARVYNAKEPFRKCRLGRLDRPPFLDGWRGYSTNVLAVVRLWKRPNSRSLRVKLLGHSYLAQSNLEDGRMFKDANGRIFVYLALPLGIPPKRAVVNTVSRVLIKCNRTTTVSCNVSLGYPRLLSYFSSSNVMDKNFVPWNGTAFMSYSHYRTFGPHSVFDWGSYEEPAFHTGFDAVAEDALFPLFSRRYGLLLHFSGGTQAILEPGGKSFLAVGHLKAHPGCFHPEATPAWALAMAAAVGISSGDGSGGAGGTSGSTATDRGAVSSRCTHLAWASSPEQKQERMDLAFIFGDPADIGFHYPWEYAFFFYRFNASPPYNLTHISHGFLPYTGSRSHDHSGIIFPIGLDRLKARRGPSGPRGPGAAGGNRTEAGGGEEVEDYLISYGDGDQASRLLLMSAAQVESMLWPLEYFEKHVDDYMVCALPCQGEENCTL